MKPCRKYRQAIAILSVQQKCEDESALRAHLADCESCREYLNNISGLAARLKRTSTPVGAPIAASERFHRQIMRRISGEESGRATPSLRSPVLVRWAVAAAVLAAIVGISLYVGSRRSPSTYWVAQNPPVAPALVNPSPAPTASEYLAVADRSLEQFDDLLTRQARRNLAPAPPVKLVSLLGGE